MRSVAGRNPAALIVTAIACLGSFTSASAQDMLPEKNVSVRDRPKPEYDAPGLDLGTFRIDSALTLGLSYNDNVYASDSDKVDDRIGTLGLSAGIASTRGIIPVALHGEISSLKYDELSEEDGVDWGAGFATGYGAGGRTQISFSGDFTRNHEPRSEGNLPEEVLDPPPFDLTDALLEVSRSFAAGSLQLSAHLQDSDYEDVRLSSGSIYDQDFRDRTTRIYEARLEMGIAHSIGALARLVRTEQDYDQRFDAAGIDHRSATNAFYVGAAFNL